MSHQGTGLEGSHAASRAKQKVQSITHLTKNQELQEIRGGGASVSGQV